MQARCSGDGRMDSVIVKMMTTRSIKGMKRGSRSLKRKTWMLFLAKRSLEDLSVEGPVVHKVNKYVQLAIHLGDFKQDPPICNAHGG